MRHLKKFLSLPLLPLFAAPKKVGGQAIIEGVMMRGRQKISWAVRRSSGAITVEQAPFASITTRSRFWRLPVMRGAANLWESLALGYRALSRSAEIAMDDERAAGAGSSDAGDKKKSDTIASWMSLGFALLLGVGLFMYLPMWALSHVVPRDSALAFNALAGALRILLFLGYLVAISLWKEMRRVFEYHGAEHKAIFTYEDDKTLTLDNMRGYTTLHPRCGTSFLLLVALLCILLFSIVDAAFIQVFGPYPSVAVRLAVHLVLIPLVGGVSYETLKLSDRYRRHPIVGALILPGLWLQKITTRQPDDGQLEVAARALDAAL